MDCCPSDLSYLEQDNLMVSNWSSHYHATNRSAVLTFVTQINAGLLIDTGDMPERTRLLGITLGNVTWIVKRSLFFRQSIEC